MSLGGITDFLNFTLKNIASSSSPCLTTEWQHSTLKADYFCQ